MATRGLGLQNSNASFEKGKNYLLTIAIDKYPAMPKLENCRIDAEALKKILLEKYNFEEAESFVLFDEAATRKGILNQLKSLKKLITANDNLLISFSGHGTVIDGRFGYWIPVDASMKEDADYISTHDIRDRLDQIDCRHLFLLVDACFSGSIFANYRSHLAFSSEGRKSRWGLAASQKDEEAFDGRPGSHSPIIQRILSFLRENDRPFSVQDLGTRIVREVEEDPTVKQSPVFGRLQMEGENTGRFVIYPRDTIFKFKNVLDYLSEGNREQAIIELENYLEIAENLPTNYAEELVFLTNRISRLKKIKSDPLEAERFQGKEHVVLQLGDTLQFRLKKVIDQLSTIDTKGRPRFKNSHILNHIARDEIELAFSKLIKKYAKKIPQVNRDANLLLYQFQLLKYERTRTKFVYEFEMQYERIIISLILLLQMLNNKENQSTPRMALIQNFSILDATQEAIYCTEDFLKFQVEESSELSFLLKTLSRNFRTLSRSEAAGNWKEEDQLLMERLKTGLFYLLENIEREHAIERQEGQPQSPIELTKKQKKEIIKGLQKGQFLNLLEKDYIQEDAFVSGLKSKYTFCKMEKDLNLELYLHGSFEIAKSLCGYYDLFDYQESIKGKVEPFYFFVAEDAVAQEESTEEIKDKLLMGLLKEAVDKLETLAVGDQFRDKRDHLRYKFAINQEDRFFTSKEVGLIESRNNNFVTELLEFLNELEADMPPT